jgi:RNA polymerase-binding protein DksA
MLSLYKKVRGIYVKKKNNKSRLTATDIKHFKALLIAKRAEILGSVLHMENEALRKPRSDLSTMPVHMADMGTDNYETENTLGLMDSERKILVEIDDALHRIEDGTYGFCEGTTKPISKERLEAIPWTRYGVDYARQMEKGLVERKESSGNSNYDVETYSEQDEDSDNPTAE